jgi:hypothetical protein
VQGNVEPSWTSTRAICYCRDCQAYARFLGTPAIVDADGGTEVVASLPQRVRLESGVDALACLSLSERGILRWYATCCGTPIANTPRSPKIPYAGLIHNCLGDASSIGATFGARRVAVNTRSALRQVRATPVATTLVVLRLMAASLGVRLGGGYRSNPFFAADARTPIRPVRVLSTPERARAYDAGQRPA